MIIFKGENVPNRPLLFYALFVSGIIEPQIIFRGGRDLIDYPQTLCLI
jgi:hypothetical protein